MSKSVFLIPMTVLAAVVLALVLVERYRMCKDVGNDHCGRQWRVTEPDQR
jgi:hypothetical protein